MDNRGPLWCRASRVLLGLVLLATLLATANPVVRGQPPMPMLRYGRAYVNFEGAVDGTLVRVESYFQSEGWVLVATDVTETVEGEPGWYGVPERLEIDGEPGGSVRFFVAGKQPFESPVAWGDPPGTYRQDLNVRLAELAAGLNVPASVNVETAFEVSATITNTGLVQAEDVQAVLSVSEGAELAPGQVATKMVGIGILPAGWARGTTWVVSCTATVPVTITVAPLGTDISTDEPIAETYLFPDSAVVEQQTPAHLVTDVLSPSQGALVGVGDPLAVTATISNTGQADALDVTATLTHTAGAELVSAAVQPVGEIPGTGVGMASWTLVCTEAHPVTVTALPAGTDGNAGGPVPAVTAEVVIDPYYPPFLTTTVEDVAGQVPVGEAFTVSTTITNTGLGAAADVTALIDLQGSAVLTTTDAPTRTIGALSAGAGTVLAWTALVTDTGPITVTVAPDGLDAASGHPIPAARRPPGILVLPQFRYHLILMPFFTAAR